MNQTSTSSPSPNLDLNAASEEMAELDHRLREDGPAAAIDRLIERLERSSSYRPLLDALLLKARHELGLALIPAEGDVIPEPQRRQFEDRSVEAIRHVGTKLLDAGEIPTAWAYFRIIGEKEAVARAIDVYQPGDDQQRLGHLIEIAFNEGVNPVRGFELILDHYGACSAITSLEQAPPMSPAEQAGCVDRLVRHLHAQVLANVRADLIQRGERALPENATLSQLLEGRSFLFDEDNYHVDVSHLSAAVRHSLVAEDPATLRLAAELADYGSQLSPRLRFEGRTPFEQTFEDCGRYVKGLLGIQQEEAIAHFRAKMEAPPEPYHDELESSLPAQALVNLLYRIGRHDEAIDVASERLARLPGAALVCPGIVELCRKGKRLDRLVEIAGQNGDLVTYLSARLVEQPAKPS